MSEENNTATEGTEGTDAVATDPKQVVVSAKNPTTEEMAALHEAIATGYDFSVDVKTTKFNFKKQKDKDSGIETVREAVELALPYPSIEGIVAIVEAGGKQLELLFESMADIINATARDIIAEDTGVNASNFPVDKVSWQAISDMPKAQRRGGGIPKETWDEFAADYIKVMPDATGKTEEQVTRAAAIMKGKLGSIKTNEPVLNLIVEQLSVYAENSENLEEFAECVEFLLKKADTFLNISPEDLLANL